MFILDSSTDYGNSIIYRKKDLNKYKCLSKAME